MVERMLGAGAMGAVYLARDRTLGRQVALKLLRTQIPEARTRFVREARALAQLAHPNVVQVFEVGVLDGVPFLAMELVRGPSLREWLQEQRSTAEIVAVFRQAALGLRAAHRRAIVHRDFKPDNVVVGLDGRVRVVDFGLAATPAQTLRDASPTPPSPDSRLTETGVVMGTPAYMAPEQYLGGSATAASDQFAYCVALWEALYGARPFAGSRSEERLRNIANAQITPPSVPRRVDRRLSAALLRGLRPYPDERWPDLDPIIAALGPPPRSRAVWTVPIGAAILTTVAVIPGEATTKAACPEERPPSGWTPDDRLEIEKRFSDSGVPYAAHSWARFETSIDNHVAAWTEAMRTTCEGLERTGDYAAFERARACLLDDRDRTATVIVDAGRDGPLSIANAPRTAAALPAPRRCASDDEPSGFVYPEDRALAAAIREVRGTYRRVHQLEMAADIEEGLELGRSALAEAEALGYGPLVAEGHYRIGRLHGAGGAFELAVEALERGYYAALESRFDALAADCASELVFIAATDLIAVDEAERWLAAFEAVLPRLPIDDSLHGWFYESMALVAEVKGDQEAALAARRDAVARLSATDGPKATPSPACSCISPTT